MSIDWQIILRPQPFLKTRYCWETRGVSHEVPCHMEMFLGGRASYCPWWFAVRYQWNFYLPVFIDNSSTPLRTVCVCASLYHSTRMACNSCGCLEFFTNWHHHFPEMFSRDVHCFHVSLSLPRPVCIWALDGELIRACGWTVGSSVVVITWMKSSQLFKVFQVRCLHSVLSLPEGFLWGTWVLFSVCVQLKNWGKVQSFR